VSVSAARGLFARECQQDDHSDAEAEPAILIKGGRTSEEGDDEEAWRGGGDATS
jgi:hypothetical protein